MEMESSISTNITVRLDIWLAAIAPILATTLAT